MMRSEDAGLPMSVVNGSAIGDKKEILFLKSTRWSFEVGKYKKRSIGTYIIHAGLVGSFRL